TRVRFPPPPLSAQPSDSRPVGGDDCKSVIFNGLEQRVGELLGVPVGVDVARRLDRLMAEELLNGLQVAVASRRRSPAVCRALCIRSPDVTPSRTIPARCRQRYHQSCRPWTPIGVSRKSVSSVRVPPSGW